MGLRSTAALASLILAPAVLGLVWIGCATADEQVDAVPKRTPRDGSSDETSTGDETSVTPGPDGAPKCSLPTAAPNSCATATDLGTVAGGGTKDVSEGIALTAGDLWFKVTFGDLQKLTSHPRVVLTSTDPNIFFEVNKTCAGELAPCGEEATTATKVKDFEVRYTWDGGVPEETGPDAGMFKPIVVGEAGAIYIHVFRSSDGAKTGCDFKLAITN